MERERERLGEGWWSYGVGKERKGNGNNREKGKSIKECGHL